MKVVFCVVVFAAIGYGVAKTSTKTADMRAMGPAATPAKDPAAASKGTETAVFAGGCFWGLEAVFEHVKGVTDVKNGYMGGVAKTANYDDVSGGQTGHAESVKITYDPTKVTYEQLLSVFFSVAHDPTELNMQGPDHGTQYRSAIFYADDNQKSAAVAYIDSLGKAKAFTAPIVTEVVPAKTFYDAEAYHQNYLERHPNEPYIVINDQPKVASLKTKYPDLYAGK